MNCGFLLCSSCQKCTGHPGTRKRDFRSRQIIAQPSITVSAAALVYHYFHSSARASRVSKSDNFTKLRTIIISYSYQNVTSQSKAAHEPEWQDDSCERRNIVSPTIIRLRTRPQAYPLNRTCVWEADEERGDI